MNRRVTLIDQEETTNWMSYFTIGLGEEIYTIHYLNSLDYEDRNRLLTFEESDAIMLVGGSPFDYLKSRYHFGIRGENYFDCSKLYRLSIEGGAFVKVILDLPDPDTVSEFLSDDFTKQADFSWYKQKIIHTFNDAIKFLDYLDSLPNDTDFGFDYEASGMPLDKQFEVSGASICTTQYGGFISFTDIRHEVGANSDQYKYLLKRLGDFLVSRQTHTWTYNMQYEFQVSHRILGVDLYNLCDASVINVLDGHHMKKYSLKWTAQRVLRATVWDTEFDRISDLIDSMLFTEEGKLKRDKHKVLKITPEDYKNTDEWKELCRRYPSFIPEFEQLMIEYWGNPFMIIPSNILGLYCNRDAFYTLMIYKAREKEYTPIAFSTFMDNLRLACRLHSCGIPKDEEFRQNYDEYCERQMAWGITYCAEARCKIKMNKHQTKMANISKYNPIVAQLLRKNKFYTGDVVEIAKDLLLSHIDRMNVSDIGLDEGALLLDYGEEFSLKFIDAVRTSMEECEMIKLYKKTGEKIVKSKITDSISSKKKLLSLVGEKLIPILELNKFKYGDVEIGTTENNKKIKHLIIDKKHIELEKYLFYEKAYNELIKVSKKQLSDINNIPSSIYAFGKRMTLLEYSNYISDNFFKCKSPVEDVEICLEFANLYKTESAYLTALSESIQQLKGAEKYYINLGIDKIEDGFDHFMQDWKKVYNNEIPIEQGQYPSKMYTLALEYFKNPGSDKVREIWNNFVGFKTQSDLFPYVKDQYLDYEKIFDEADLTNNFFFMRKLSLSYLLFKKYAKLKSTYVGQDPDDESKKGMFLKTDTWVIEDPKSHIMIREADPNEPGAICKMRPHFECMEKSSKRWSSGYH